VPSVRPTSGKQAEAWIKERMGEYFRRPESVAYRSQAAWSLKQMDDRFSFLKPGSVVVDLGCFPGGWSQVAIERTVAQSGTGKVIGVDTVRIDPIDHHTFIMGDVSSDATLLKLQEELGGSRADVILSDLSPSLTGLKTEDHLGSMQCCLHAARVMESTLRLGGWFVVKLVWGAEQVNWKTYLESRFHTVRTIKPAASRSTKGEMFCCCRGFRGREPIAEEVPRGSMNLTKHEGIDRWDSEIRKPQ